MSLLARMYAKETPKPPGSALAVSYGGGVNSVAALIYLARHGLRPAATVMAERQLHVWADGGYELDGMPREETMPCECAL